MIIYARFENNINRVIVPFCSEHNPLGGKAMSGLNSKKIIIRTHMYTYMHTQPANIHITSKYSCLFLRPEYWHYALGKSTAKQMSDNRKSNIIGFTMSRIYIAKYARGVNT